MRRYGGGEEMKTWRSKLGVAQVRAATILGCSRQLIAAIEAGRSPLVRPRRKRMEEALAEFERAGMEAVDLMPEFRCVRQRRGRSPVPEEDRETMKTWRRENDMTAWEAAEDLGLSIHSIRAIERGLIRISDRVRANMRGRT